MSQFESLFEHDLYHARLDKLQQIAALARAADPSLADANAKYPNHFRFSTKPGSTEPIDIPTIKQLYDSPTAPITAEQLEAAPPAVALAGRLVAIRLQGKAGFAQLQQGGQRLQIYIRKDDVGSTPEQSEALFSLYKLLDLGDHIGVRGHLMRTRTGELTLKVSPVSLPGDLTPSPSEALNTPESPAVRVAPARVAPAITFLTKALLPLPDKYSGLGDIELRYRRRYLDLFTDTGDTPEPAPTPAPSPIPAPAPTSTNPAQQPVILSAPGTPETPVILSEAQSAQSKDPDASNPAPTSQSLSTPSPLQTLSSRPESATALPTTLSSRPETERSSDAAERPAGLDHPGAAASKGTGFSPSIEAPQTQGALAPEGTRLPARVVFEKRAAILRSIRRFFDTRNFLEVETPMLHTISGGAAARPFETHHNALDIPLKLRIAPELYLKRLVVGGFDRVYEINRNFRNEGVSTQHNPEFTMLEFYQAYANYHDLMDLTQELITVVAQEVNGTPLTHFNGTAIDLSHWTKLSMREAIIKWWPQLLGESPTLETFVNIRTFYEWLDSNLASCSTLPHSDMTPEEFFAARVRVALTLYRASPAENSMGKLIATIFEEVAEAKLIQPTIIYDFPLAVSPLSKVKPDEPDWVERFEFYIGGFEVGNAFSELNDPDDQRRRFEAQLEDRKRGDDEAMAEVDEDYVRALGYGLPPTAGEGIGIDRLTMILTGSRSIRDVILFPLMRPHAKPATPDDATPHPPSS